MLSLQSACPWCVCRIVTRALQYLCGQDSSPLLQVLGHSCRCKSCGASRTFAAIAVAEAAAGAPFALAVAVGVLVD